MLLTVKYTDKIHGIIACYDHMIIQEYIPNWSHADAMTAYMKSNGIRIFNYPGFSQSLTEQFRQNAEKLLRKTGLKLSSSVNSILSVKMTVFRKSLLKPENRRPCPYLFRHGIPQAGQKQIDYRKHDKAFLEISDIETAQELFDRINPEDLHKVLDVFAWRYSPVPGFLGLGYTWTLQQIECGTGSPAQRWNHQYPKSPSEKEYLQPVPVVHNPEICKLLLP